MKRQKESAESRLFIVDGTEPLNGVGRIGDPIRRVGEGRGMSPTQRNATNFVAFRDGDVHRPGCVVQAPGVGSLPVLVAKLSYSRRGTRSRVEG